MLATAVRPHRRVAVLGIVTGLVWTGAKLAVPALIARTIDLGVVGRDRRELAVGIAVVLGVGVVGALVAAFRRWYAQLLAFLVERDIRLRLVRHVYGLDLGFHRATPSGLIVSRTGTDLLQIQQPFIVIPMLLSSVVMFVGAAVLLVRIDPLLTVVALTPAALVLVVALRFTASLEPRSKALQDRLADLASGAEESISGIAAIKGLGAEAAELERLRGGIGRVHATAMQLTRVRARYLPLFDFLPAVGLTGTLWLGARMVAADEITLGQLVQFNAYVLLLVGPLRMVGMTLSQLQRALVSASLIGELLEVDPAIADPDDPEPLRAERGEVRFEGVGYSYPGSTEPALDGVDLVVRPGETVALVGATGSGKSTLVSLLARLDDVTEGRVLIDGVDVRAARLADVRKAVAMVFEDTLLFAGTLVDNIGFGAPHQPRDRVEEVSRAVGVHEFAAAAEGGYDAVVGERGAGLSGGQRQRVGLARALLADARILVLDSATSAIDAVTEAEIHRAITRAAGGRTTFLIAHRPSSIALADRVVLLHEGRIADAGSHAELLSRSALYRRVLAEAHQPDETVELAG